MNAGELFDMIIAHIRRADISRDEFNKMLPNILKSLWRTINFYSLSKSEKLIPSSSWTFPTPSDFWDDISIIAISSQVTTASYYINPVTSSSDFLLLLGSRDLSYLNSYHSPSLPSWYYIGTPSKLFANYTGIIDTGKEDLKSIIVFPPLDTSRYELFLTYYPDVVIIPTEVTDDYEHPLMAKYSEWVFYEVLWRIYAQFRDFEAASNFKAIAAEKLLEVKAIEAREILEPTKTLHLVSHQLSRRRTKGPDVVGEGSHWGVIIRAAD